MNDHVRGAKRRMCSTLSSTWSVGRSHSPTSWRMNAAFTAFVVPPRWTTIGPNLKRESIAKTFARFSKP